MTMIVIHDDALGSVTVSDDRVSPLMQPGFVSEEL